VNLSNGQTLQELSLNALEKYLPSNKLLPKCRNDLTQHSIYSVNIILLYRDNGDSNHSQWWQVFNFFQSILTHRIPFYLPKTVLGRVEPEMLSPFYS
jgi:hypothetical protein